MIAAFFARPLVKWGALVLVVIALLSLGWCAYDRTIEKGEKAGAAAVTDAVQTKTINDVEKARQAKEKADDAVRTTPYPDRVDGLR